MSEVHAPYHFVPLSKWVYMPDWAHLVSHDVPFAAGFCGSIDYSLTNHTPLCVGGEQVRQQGKPSFVQWVKDPFGSPVIPGSSLKGMLRSVLEIASFGKFGQIDNHHYSFRDISTGKTRYNKEILDSKAQAYWLKYDTERASWTLRKSQFTTLFHDEFNKATGCKIVNQSHEQPAEQKYQQWPLSKPAIRFELAERKMEGTKGKMVNVSRALPETTGSVHGYPVFSGFRPGSKKYIEGRLNFSYVFYGESEQASTFTNGDEQANKLFSNHSDDLVGYLKSNPHPELGIPVFARERNGQILALGFAQMPRKLYDRSVHDLANKTQPLQEALNTFDLAELMFGTLRDEGFGLRSRVFFSDAQCTVNKGFSSSSAVILGQPKASYLPAYLEQPQAQDNQVDGDLSQYEQNSQLKGWKRYPVQSQFSSEIPADLQSKIAVQGQLELLKEQSCFKGKLVFHNLKAQELGALLWSLCLGDQTNPKQHSLGHGKPLGAGAVRICLNALNLNRANHQTDAPLPTAEQLLNDFTEMMEAKHPKSWAKSPQLRHLLSFAEPSASDGRNMEYMTLNQYTESQKSNKKQVLPNWKDQQGEIPRTEEISGKETVPSSFAQGRLAKLFTSTKAQGLTTGRELEFAAEIEQQKKQDALAALSPEHQTYMKLTDRLVSATDKEQRQSCNTEIELLLERCLAATLDEAFIADFYHLCLDTKRSAYLDLAKNKRNKDKLAQRKQKLAALAEQYQLLSNG